MWHLLRSLSFVFYISLVICFAMYVPLCTSYSSLLDLYSISFSFSDFGYWLCVISWLYYLLSSLLKMVRCNQIKTVCWFSPSIILSLSVLLMFFSFSSFVLILPFLPYSRSLPPRPLPPSIILLGSVLPCSNPIPHNFPLLLLLLTPLLIPGNLLLLIVPNPIVSLFH